MGLSHTHTGINLSVCVHTKATTTTLGTVHRPAYPTTVQTNKLALASLSQFPINCSALPAAANLLTPVGLV